MRRALGAVFLVLSLTACGSTVQVTSTTTPLTGDGLGQVAPSDLTGGVVTAPGGGVGVTTGTTTGSRDRSPQASTVPGQLAPAPRSSTAGPVPQGVVTREPVRIGVISSPGIDKAASAVGVNGLTTGDTKAQADAVIGWIRAHGGLGGHPIKVFHYEIDVQQSADNPDVAYEKACVAMKQDYKVRYVVTILNLRPGSLPCFSKGGIGVLDDQVSVGDATMSKYRDFLANPGEIAPGRMMTTLVDDLVSRGWLTPASVVGSFAYDTPDWRTTVESFLAPALKRHGIALKTRQYVTNGASSINEASAAALKYRSEGVDRIIPVGASPLFLMNAASSQGYRPWYAMYSSFGPGALLEGTAPKDQLKHSAGIGWQPYLDIGAGNKPGPVSPRETLCFDIMKKAGQGTNAPTTKGFQAQICNVLLYLKDAADRLPAMPENLLSQARPLLGASFVSADTFRTDVTNRTDGVAGFRSLAYREDCSCYQYVSPVKPTS